jgi:predicted SnoaL-like aldol condensation-catalyzing enzyme
MTKKTTRALILLGAFGAALCLAPGSVAAQEKLDKNAQFCEDFDQNVIIMGKLDEASKYLTDDFKEHNARLTANGLPEFLDKMKGFQAARAARAGGGGTRGGGAARGPAPMRTVFSHDDVVVFLTPQPGRPDPNNPGQQLAASTHFDVYRLRNGKIAEHWD